MWSNFVKCRNICSKLNLDVHLTMPLSGEIYLVKFNLILLVGFSSNDRISKLFGNISVGL